MKTVENMSLPSRLASQAPFFSPTLYPCLIPPAPRLSFHKKNFFFFPNKQDGSKRCNLQMYEINMIPNEPLGKCSPLNLAKDYGGKKMS